MEIVKRQFVLWSVILLLLMTLSSVAFAADENPTSEQEVTAQQVEGTVPVYRVLNTGNGEHLYTVDPAEVQRLIAAGWRNEGTAWYSSIVGTPVFRLYHPVVGYHLYTTEQSEIDTLLSQFGWLPDNNGQAVFNSAGDVPVYRVCNTSNGVHHLTTDVNEYNTLPSQGWAQEGAPIMAVQTGEIIAWPNEAQAALDLQRLQQEYPKGMHWSYDNSHLSPAFQPWPKSACDGFALLASDYIFGNIPGHFHQNKEAVRIGDLIRYNDETTGGHAVVVMSHEGEWVTVAEGNWSRSVNYGRRLNIYKPTFHLEYIWTRYP